MQALLAHYNVRRSVIVTLASCYVSLKLSHDTAKPYAIKAWQIVTSEEAKRCYAFVILGTIALFWMSAFAAVWLGNRSREQYDRFVIWRDRFVQSHLQSEFLVGSEIAEEGCAEMVSDAIAVAGVTHITELFAQADAATVAPTKRRRLAKVSRSLQPATA